MLGLLPTAILGDDLTTFLDDAGVVLFYLAVWGLVFAGTALMVGFFIPFLTGDSLLFASGLVAAAASGINIIVLAVGTGIAAFLGDQVGFILGRHFGRPYLDRHSGRRVREAIRQTEKFYATFGWWSVVIARFVPWARVFVPIIAGVGRMNYYKFLWANLFGALAWGVGLTVIGFYAASIPAVKNSAYAIAGLLIAFSIVAGIRSWRKEKRLDAEEAAREASALQS